MGDRSAEVMADYFLTMSDAGEMRNAEGEHVLISQR